MDKLASAKLPELLSFPKDQSIKILYPNKYIYLSVFKLPQNAGTRIECLT